MLLWATNILLDELVLRKKNLNSNFESKRRNCITFEQSQLLKADVTLISKKGFYVNKISEESVIKPFCQCFKALLDLKFDNLLNCPWSRDCFGRWLLT